MTDTPDPESAEKPLDLTDRLLCPNSSSPLVRKGEAYLCTDAECRMSFPIWDDMPILLIDEATELPLEEWQQVVQG